MNEMANAGCPRVEDVSALMDGALAGSQGDEIARHVAHCALCGALLSDFEAMSGRMQVLRDTRCDVDLAALVAPQLPPRTQAARQRAPRRRDAWSLAPRGLAAAAALAAGAYLGSLMLVGGGMAVRPVAMTVFDAAPPGALCAGVPPCPPRGR
jgi:hypothetical protein